jgi:hypothetical protein
MIRENYRNHHTRSGRVWSRYPVTYRDDSDAKKLIETLHEREKRDQDVSAVWKMRGDEQPANSD